MQRKMTNKVVLGLLVLACMPSSTVRPQGYIPDFSGTWWELNVDPNKAMKLNITQNGNVLNEEVFGRLTILRGIASGKYVQQCAPPFRQLGYDYDANPSYATVVLGLKGKTLVFNRDTHWVAPCGGHPIGTEHDTHLFQRYP